MGYAVQLAHDKTEGTRNDEWNGWVKIKDDAGAVLSECKDYQHNRKDQTAEDIAELTKGIAAA